MKKLIIICEGQTEQEFCDKLLKNHFAALNIDIDYPLIIHSNGGIVKWQHLQKQIELHHVTTPPAFITTFIDYYGMEPHHLFPDWAIAHGEADRPRRMEILEQGMYQSLDASLQPQFVPYIQLHEFEALVFSDYSAFGQYYAPRDYNAIALTVLCAQAPESINNGRTTAPSKRLEAHVRGYDKVLDGPELVQIIGLDAIRMKCPRFDDWISRLERI